MTPTPPPPPPDPRLGDLISALWDEYMVIYGSEKLAAVAVAATVNDLLTRRRPNAIDLS